MIAFCQNAPLRKEPESLISCRMQTLQACYSALPNALDWFTSDTGGILCRFGSALLILDDVDFDALFAFADMMGINRIEWLSNGITAHAQSAGWTSSCYTVLHCVGHAAPTSANIEPNGSLQRCFSLLCQSDAAFAREVDYLSWLSDMTRRRNVGRAKTFIHGDAAVACITARGQHSAYLSSVAVLPEKRGQGLGLTLLRAVLAHDTLDNTDIFTVAQSKSLVDFYRQARFTVLPQLLTIAEKRKA
ncbi:MAG: GNAT family N-acetyltransferase [Candidatus Fimivivens sp.]